MSFDTPVLLVLALLAVAALAVAVVLVARRRADALAAAGVAVRRRSRQPGLWLSIAGLAVLAVGVAGPVASVPVPRAAGTVIVAVDVSNSMTADDVRPTRLAAAQHAARAFIDAQPTSVDVGVVAFEQGALTTARPSADHAPAQAAIARLRTQGGTSLGDAILTALSAITGKTVRLQPDGSVPSIGYWGSATIVLFSDGQDSGGPDIAAAAETAQNAGVHVETVGVGTTEGTTVEVDGYRLHTALDEDALRGIARTTGGSYHPAADAGELDSVASGIDLRLVVADRPVPLAGYAIGLALLLLVAGAVLTVGRVGRLV